MNEHLKDWIPLFQTLVWPIFIVLVIFSFRRRVESLLDSVKKRIEDGSSVGLGPGGLSLGSAPQLPDIPVPEEMIDDEEESKTVPEQSPEQHVSAASLSKKTDKNIQLIHRTHFLRIKNGRDYYRIIVSLDAYDTDVLSQVERVVYYLHKTFKNPVREVTDRASNFELRTAAWGEFTIRADVYFKGESEPSRLSRYLEIRTQSPYG